jgi:hypothetical protein
MKNQTYLSSRSQARRVNAPTIICRRSGAWPGLLLAACWALLIGLAHPARAAVTEAWVQRYNNVNSNSTDQAFAVVSDAAGDIIVVGSTEDGNSGPDMLTIKYSGANGSVLWQKRYNGPANGEDYASAVAVDVKGNVVVTGSSSGTSGHDYYTAKYAAADGALLWEKRSNGPANGEDYASAVAVDGSGNVVMTGGSYDQNGFVFAGDYYTAKYAAADGALLWEKRYNGPGNDRDTASAVAVDGSGNVVVTGGSYGSGSFLDYYTAKYAAVDGALLWEKRYNGPANGDDYASAVAVDGSGNVVVTGSSDREYGPPFTGDYYTAKYAAADGALLWEKRYNGPENDRDAAEAVAVDSGGNVVVTGSSGLFSGADYYTAKYAAADGALLWERRYNGPASNRDRARAVALDESGNVVVTGHSVNGEYGIDYYTAKYAAPDGALLWEQRYNDSANGDDYASSLALGPNGMVVITGFVITGSSNRDYATVVYRETLPPLAIELVPTGVRLRLTGVPSRSYTIESAPAVSGPWSTLATFTAPLSGLNEYLDTNPPVSAAFYRTTEP